LQSIRFWPESCKTSSKTLGDLRRLELAALERQFGRDGLRLHELARGVDYSEVVSDRPTQSISRAARRLTLYRWTSIVTREAAHETEELLTYNARSLPSPSRDRPMNIRLHFLFIKALDVCGDLFKTVLHRKMTGVETVHLRLR